MLGVSSDKSYLHRCVFVSQTAPFDTDEKLELVGSEIKSPKEDFGYHCISQPCKAASSERDSTYTMYISKRSQRVILCHGCE